MALDLTESVATLRPVFSASSVRDVSAPASDVGRPSSAGRRGTPVPLLRNFQAFARRLEEATRKEWVARGVRADVRLEAGTLLFAFGGAGVGALRADLDAWLRERVPSWRGVGLEPYPPVWNLLARGGLVLFAVRPRWLPASAPVPPSLRRLLGPKPPKTGPSGVASGRRLSRVHTAASASKMNVYALDFDAAAQARLPAPVSPKPGYRCASIW